MGEQSGLVPKPESTDNGNTDIAPSMAEAVAESTDFTSEPTAKTEPEIQQIAIEAEGEMSVPDVGPVVESASGVPTEEVSELPQADIPPLVQDSLVEPVEQSLTNDDQPSFDAGGLVDGAVTLDGSAAASNEETSKSDSPASPKVFTAPEPAPAAEEPTMAPATENDLAESDDQ